MTILPLVVIAAAVPLWLERDVAAGSAAADAARASVLIEDEGQRANAIERTGEELALRTALSGCDDECSGLEVTAAPDGGAHAEAWIWAPGVRRLGGGTGPDFWLRRHVSIPGDPYPNPP